jgi:hypothetical protein
MVDWTVEKIAALSTEDLKSLRANAAAKSNQQLIDLCDAELLVRVPRRTRAQVNRGPNESRRGQYVCGYHFVCPSETGLTFNADHTVWTGTWVVDKENAEMSSRYGAYVALHTSKSEPSYLQGALKDWRQAKRNAEYADGRPVRIPLGIDLLFDPAGQPYEWSGDGSGEKGYVWKEIPK